MRGCKNHSYLLCISCYKTDTESSRQGIQKKCPKNDCELRPYNCPSDSISCSECAKRIEKGAPMRGCKNHSYLLCFSCVGSKGSRSLFSKRGSFGFDAISNVAKMTLRQQRETANIA